MKTETELLIEAWQVQDACNLSGVVHSFSRAVSDLWKLFPEKGTEFINTHEVCILYADKIKQLSTISDRACFDAFDHAYEVNKRATETDQCYVKGYN